MKKTAILVTFDKKLTGTNDRIFDAIIALLRESGDDSDITCSFREYDDEYGGPVIYIP